MLGRSEVEVPTHHHQAIDKIGRGLVATAWAEDGIIEAVEFDHSGLSAPAMLAVQWHPEVGDDLSLFEWLVAAAARFVPELART